MDHPAHRPVWKGVDESSEESMARPGSVGGRVAPDVTARLDRGLGATGIETGPIGRETATGRPLAEPLDRLARRHRDRHDVLRRLDEWDIEQHRQTATRLDLGRRPVAVVPAAVRPGRGRISRRYIRQIARFSCGPGQVEEERGIKPLDLENSGGSLEISLIVQTTNESLVRSFSQDRIVPKSRAETPESPADPDDPASAFSTSSTIRRRATSRRPAATPGEH